MSRMPRTKTVLAAAAYVALAATDSYLAGRAAADPAARRARYLTKPALMPTLGVAFARGTEGRSDLLRRGTLAAEALSWGGDVALLRSGERPFLAGVGSFFGAHVGYLAALLSVRGKPADYDLTGLKTALGVWAAAAPAMSVAAGRQDPELRVPVAAYATILSAMFASSRMLDPALPRRSRRAVQAGTALFLVSDALLATGKFLLGEPHPALETAVMATYTAGQGLIAAGVAGSG
jgi:uncharacterized membrane protein YhhN